MDNRDTPLCDGGYLLASSNHAKNPPGPFCTLPKDAEIKKKRKKNKKSVRFFRCVKLIRREVIMNVPRCDTGVCFFVIRHKAFKWIHIKVRAVMNLLLTIKQNHNVAIREQKRATSIDAQWLKRHGELIFHRCYRMLGDREQAYDAMQEVLTRLLEVQAKRELEQPLHYLYRMSTNHCLDLLGRSGRTLPMPREEPQAKERRMPSESALLVRELVDQFGTDDIALLACRYVDGMTYQELGELHNRSDRAMKKRLDKIEAAIRHYLSKENPSPRKAK